MRLRLIFTHYATMQIETHLCHRTYQQTVLLSAKQYITVCLSHSLLIYPPAVGHWDFALILLSAVFAFNTMVHNLQSSLCSLVSYYGNIGMLMFLIIMNQNKRKLTWLSRFSTSSHSFEFHSPWLTLFPLYNVTTLLWNEYCWLKTLIHWNLTMWYTAVLGI